MCAERLGAPNSVEYHWSGSSPCLGLKSVWMPFAALTAFASKGLLGSQVAEGVELGVSFEL